MREVVCASSERKRRGEIRKRVITRLITVVPHSTEIVWQTFFRCCSRWQDLTLILSLASVASVFCVEDNARACWEGKREIIIVRTQSQSYSEWNYYTKTKCNIGNNIKIDNHEMKQQSNFIKNVQILSKIKENTHTCQSSTQIRWLASFTLSVFRNAVMQSQPIKCLY